MSEIISLAKFSFLVAICPLFDLSLLHKVDIPKKRMKGLYKKKTWIKENLTFFEMKDLYVQTFLVYNIINDPQMYKITSHDINDKYTFFDFILFIISIFTSD